MWLKKQQGRQYGTAHVLPLPIWMSEGPNVYLQGVHLNIFILFLSQNK